MPRIRLNHVAQVRSGDKGNTADITVFAPSRQLYDCFRAQISAEVVKQQLRHLVEGEVVRYEVPNLRALKFVCRGALNGGGSSSLRLDALGKCLGANLLRIELDVPDDLLVTRN